MKKVLLGTTALVAAAAFAGIGVAQADDEMMAEPISLGVGGYYTAAFVNGEAGGEDERGHYINQNSEIQFAGSTTLDNGMTAGVRARLSTNAESGGADEREIYFSGGFGSIHIGNIEGAAQQRDTFAPSGNTIGGIKSPWFGAGFTSWNTSPIMNEDAHKIVYFAPDFNGLGIGVSYAPDDSADSYAGQSTADGGWSEQMTAALNYSVDVGGGSLSASLGLEEYTAEADPATGDVGDGASAMRYGLSLGIDDIAIGGSIVEQEYGGTSATHSEYGVSWSQGAMSLGLMYGSSEVDDATTNITAVALGYNMGPGIDVSLKANSVDQDGGDSYSQILLGTFFSF